MGLSLQCQGIATSGTLGGFVRVRSASDSLVVGLTCHHVIQDADIKDVQQHGCGNLNAELGYTHPVRVPSLDDEARATSSAQKEIDRLPFMAIPPGSKATLKQDEERCQREKTTTISQHPQFGSAMTTSRFRSVFARGVEFAMDWALIQPDYKRQCSNQVRYINVFLRNAR